MAGTDLSGMGIGQSSRPGVQPEQQQVFPKFDAANVNDQLNSTLNSNSLLMRVAKSNGQAAATQRGLGNSSIGAEASQRAMVDAALPIAQQNAQQANSRFMQDDSQAFTAGESAKDRSQQITMQQNDFSNQTNQAKLNAGLTEARDQLLYQQNLGTLDKQGQLELQQLNAQLKNQTTLNNQQFGQQKELNQQQAYLQAERDTLLNKFQQGVLDKEGQQRLQELDVQLRNQMTINNQQNSWNSAEAQKDRQQALTLLEKQFGQETSQLAQQVAANTHGMYLSAIDTAMSSYNERYAALMADATIKTADKTTMLNNMKNELNSTLTMYQKLYSNINTINPDWTKFPTTSLPGVKVS